jgi:hypothetical protein
MSVFKKYAIRSSLCYENTHFITRSGGTSMLKVHAVSDGISIDNCPSVLCEGLSLARIQHNLSFCTYSLILRSNIWRVVILQWKEWEERIITRKLLNISMSNVKPLEGI